MGSSSHTYTDLQIVPIMKDYTSLTTKLLTYDGQQISRGMPAVLNARKNTMLTMKSTMKPAVMKRWGFEASSTATIQRVDIDLVLDYLRTTVDINVSSIQSAEVGFATTDELGHLVLQDTYPDYSVDLQEFVHTNGGTYKYISTTEAGGGVLDISCYRKPSKSYILSQYTGIHDTISVVSYLDYLIETSPGVFEISANMAYNSYHVTETTTDANSNISVNTYDTTVIGTVVAGTVNNGNGTTTETTIIVTSVQEAVYIPVEYLYLSGTDPSYAFLDGLISTYNGVHTGIIHDGWSKYLYSGSIHNTARTKTYGIGPIPLINTWMAGYSIPDPSYSYESIKYDINRTITKVGVSSINISCVASNPTHTTTDNYFDMIEAYEVSYIYSEIENALAAQDKDIVVKYRLNNKSYLYKIPNTISSQYITDSLVDTMPIFSLKVGGVLQSNSKIKLALRDLGLVGNEFDASIADPKVKYASLGFMFDPNDTSNATTRLMYETFSNLNSNGYTMNKSGTALASGGDTVGLKMQFEGLVVTVSSGYSISTIAGTIGNVGTYTREQVEYTITELDPNHMGKSSSYVDVTKVKRIYRKQLNDQYYSEIVLDDLLVHHSYAGTSDVSTRNTYGTASKVGRLPILREVLIKLPFDSYLELLQSSLVLFVYTSVTVTTKWYQSGFFRFVLTVVAVAIAVLSWGAASAASYSLLSVVAAVGATAGAILAVASLAGIDLGVVGDILQVVAIVAGVATLVSSSISYVNSLSTQTSTISASATAGAETARQLGQRATQLGSSYGPLASKVATSLEELASDASVASEGFVSTGAELLSPTMTTFNDVVSSMNSYSIVAPEVTQAFNSAIDEVFANSTLDMMLEGVGIVNKTAKTVSSIDNFIHRNELNNIKRDLEALQEQANKAQEELAKVKNAKAQALMLAPQDIETMYDKMTETPNPMVGIENLYENLTMSTGYNMEQMMWS